MSKVIVFEMDKMRSLDIVPVIESSSISYQVIRPYLNEKLPSIDYDAVIISGGSPTVTNLSKYKFLEPFLKYTTDLIENDVSILGICLGHQILGKCLGGEVKEKELSVGFYDINHSKNNVFESLENPLTVFKYHKYYVSEIPENIEIIASSNDIDIEAFKIKKVTGVQFHPEITSEHIVNAVTNFFSDEIIKIGKTPQEILLERNKYSEYFNKSIIRNFLGRLK